MDPKTYKFDTLSLHAGYQPDKNSGSRQVPIYQTTSYLFDDVDHAAALFNLERGGHIYSRISNPTVGVLEERVAALEGGTAAIATSSGMAAIFLAIMTLCESGDQMPNPFSNLKDNKAVKTKFSDTAFCTGFQQ